MADVRPPATVLQFIATIESRKPEDKLREFIVSFYVEDRAFEVFERYIPNSGFQSGKFLQKTVFKTPSGEEFGPSDVYIGAKLNLGGWIFVLQEASEDTLRTMEARSDIFQKCDLSKLIDVSRQRVKGKVPQMLVAFQKKDVKKRKRLGLEEIQSVLEEFGLNFGDQEFLTLFRRYQVEDTIEFDYEAFAKSLV